MDIRKAADSERDLWNGFVACWISGDLLQSYEWGEVKARSGGWEPIRLMAVEDGAPVAVASILRRAIPRLGKSLFYAPRGPVGDLSNREILAGLIDAVRSLAKERSAVLLKVDPPTSIDDHQSELNLRAIGFRPIDGAGFGGTQPKCVMQLDLTRSEDDLLAACKPKTRYNIRLAERKGVAVRQAEDENDLRAFYDLLLETAKRDRFLVRDYSYYRVLWEVLSPPEFVRLFLAEYGNQPIAGALCFYMGDRCWYTYGASSNSHREVMPNHLMQWSMIRHAKSIGCRVYDFRGVSPRREHDPNDRLQGLNRFKEGFGAHYMEYIGEYDLPFSRPMYWVWSKAAPVASALMKGWKRSRPAASVEV